MLGRRGACSEVEQHDASLRFAILAIALADDRPPARLVEHRRELKLSRSSSDQSRRGTASKAAYRPTRQRPCKLRHIRLAVTGTHPERVKLHDLTREILVETTLPA